MARSLLIQTNGDHEYRHINSAEDIREAVGGSFDWASTRGCIMECYEYALYELPVNIFASFICWQDAFREGYEPMRGTSGVALPLSGPVLISGPADENGDATDCPDWVVGEFLRAKQKASQGLLDMTRGILDPSEIPGPIVQYPQVETVDIPDDTDGHHRQSIIKKEDR